MDFKPLTGTVTIPAGAVQVKVKIKPIGNGTANGPLVTKIKPKPSGDGSYHLGDSVVAKVQIIDHD